MHEQTLLYRIGGNINRCAVFVIGLFNGWLIPGINLTNIVMISAMILAYFIIWLVKYLVYKKEIDDINKGVKLLKSREDS
jgi:cytosine/uracil/thiamine/allantoin permease